MKPLNNILSVESSKLPQIFSDASNIDKKNIKLYNCCFLGNVDSGKSTTVGRILFETKALPEHVLAKYKSEAETLNKGSFAFAWAMDTSKEERERGVTINLSHAELALNDRYYTIIDAPGHRDFTKTMIVGTSQADLAILLIDAQEGIIPGTTTAEHALIARSTGISSIIVCLNKINNVHESEREKIYNQRVEEVSTLLKNYGYHDHKTRIIPVNSLEGWNIKQNHPQLGFYKGPTLLEAMNEIPLEEVSDELPFRLAIEQVCPKIGGSNCVITGKVLSGVLKPNEEVTLKPTANLETKIGRVGSIEMHGKGIKWAPKGANVGIDVKNISKELFAKGAVLSHVQSAPKLVNEFSLRHAVIMEHPTQIVTNSNLICHWNTTNMPCKVKKLYDSYDLSVYKGDFQEHLNNNDVVGFTRGEVKYVKPGSICGMTLEPTKPMVVETDKEHPKLCKVLLRDFNTTIARGNVTDKVLHKSEIK